MREVVAGALALALLLVVGFAAWSVLGGIGAEPPEDTDGPAVAAEAWATAATAGDVAGLATLTPPGSDDGALRTATAALWDALGGPPEVEVTLVEVEGGAATATLASTAALGRTGTWQWESQLRLERSRGEWGVAWEPTALHPELRPRWQVEVRTGGPTRAGILDRSGRTLTGGEQLVEVGVQPSRLPGPERVERVVGEALPEALPALRALLARDVVSPDAFHRLVTVDAARADEVWSQLLAVPGMLRRPAQGGTSAAPFAPDVVGQVEERDGAVVGVSGLQAERDADLTGSEVVEAVLVDPEGRDREVLAQVQRKPSLPVVTTLDRDVQQAVQDVLLGELRQVGIVVVDVPTGGLVATGSAPATGYPRALRDRHPPGLLAGTVPLTAALLGGQAPDETVPCGRDVVAGGLRVRDTTGPSGRRPLRGVLAPGCAGGVARLGAALDGDALGAAAGALGLDLAPRVVVEAAGWRPATGAGPAAASGAVGQGTVTTSTLAAAALIGTVARGVPVPPHVLADPSPAAGEELPPGTAAALRAAFVRAADGGPVGAPGVTVAGVGSGTRAVVDDPAPATGWWSGWIVDGGPEVALAVTVADDDGTAAGRIADRLVRALAS